MYFINLWSVSYYDSECLSESNCLIIEIVNKGCFGRIEKMVGYESEEIKCKSYIGWCLNISINQTINHKNKKPNIFFL
jgi:hypothetical protein